ncbi:MAG TPA: SAM-dependent methyltransferase [Noviherbaspirillum sp.]|nr:SAM-dependent methyltransferase [Noviherbaspirillum sp.]
MTAGVLYLIPNTLGVDPGPGDPLVALIPQQVQELTAGLEYFIAENAKTARAHLKLVGARHPLARPLQEILIAELNVNTPDATLTELLAPLQAGRDAGLISEAGVPAVADPGANLVRLAHREGIRVRPLVGPSSLLLAVMASGLNGQSFAFNGYLPTDAGARAKRIRQLEERSRQERQTQLFIETPYRNHALLDALLATCQSGTRLCVASDLTLESETIQMHAVAHWRRLAVSGQLPDLRKRPTVFLLLASD